MKPHSLWYFVLAAWVDQYRQNKEIREVVQAQNHWKTWGKTVSRNLIRTLDDNEMFTATSEYLTKRKAMKTQ